ncbi:MAG: hypothetical protein EXR79_14195, partial [Myxococcales bacterium]|nr:hypothetical protein [Myxococcales bacterium]
KAAKTAKCKALAAAQRKAEAQRKLAALCKQKAQRGTKACKALRAAQAKHRSHGSICGRRYGTAKKNEKVASFARRYKVAEARVRELNALAAATKKLKGGKRYVVFKSPHEGVVLTNGVLLEPLAGIVGLQRPQRGWGKPLLVDALRLAAEAVQRSAPLGTTLVMGDLSKQGGGCLPPHRSHRGGLDADIGLYFRGGHQRTWLGQATPDTLDADRTWLLLRVLLATGRLQYAFIDHGLQPALHEAALRAGESPDTLQAIIQWPRPIGEHGGAIVRHLGGHDDHLHVRLACPEGDPCALDDLGRARLGALQFDRQGGVAAEQVRSTRRSSRWVQGPGVAVPAALP